MSWTVAVTGRGDDDSAARVRGCYGLCWCRDRRIAGRRTRPAGGRRSCGVRRCPGPAQPAGVIAARGISALAEPGVTYPAAIVAGIGASRRAGWRRACVPLLVVATGAAARRRLSRVIARPRPPAAAWLIEPEGFSLPSKHTTIAALTAGACVQAAGARSPRYAAPALAAAAVGASRVYLGVHWPGDVLAGWMFAAGWLWLTDPG